MVVLGPLHPGIAMMSTDIGTTAAVVADGTDGMTTGETEANGLDAHARDLLLVRGPVPVPVLVPVLARGDVMNERETAKPSVLT